MGKVEEENRGNLRKLQAMDIADATVAKEMLSQGEERAADAYGGNFFVHGSLTDMIGDLKTIARLHDRWAPLLAQLSDAEDRAGIKVPAPVRAKLLPRTQVLAAFKAQNRKEIDKWRK